MQGAGNENAADATTMEFDEIFAAAHAAGGEDVFARRLRLQVIQKSKIGSSVTADTAEGHGNQTLRPQLRLVPQLDRTKELPILEIQGQDDPVGRHSGRQPIDRIRVSLCLGAENE